MHVASVEKTNEARAKAAYQSIINSIFNYETPTALPSASYPSLDAQAAYAGLHDADSHTPAVDDAALAAQFGEPVDAPAPASSTGALSSPPYLAATDMDDAAGRAAGMKRRSAAVRSGAAAASTTPAPGAFSDAAVPAASGAGAPPAKRGRRGVATTAAAASSGNVPGASDVEAHEPEASTSGAGVDTPAGTAGVSADGSVPTTDAVDGVMASSAATSATGSASNGDASGAAAGVTSGAAAAPPATASGATTSGAASSGVGGGKKTSVTRGSRRDVPQAAGGGMNALLQAVEYGEDKGGKASKQQASGAPAAAALTSTPASAT